MNPKRRTSSDAESGAIVKHWKGRISVALVFPSQYAVGMANLGFQTVYKLLNDLEHVVCERAFVPDGGPEGPEPIRTVESGRSLAAFDCIAFSLSFENDFPNVLSVLRKAGLPLRSASRGASLPLVMAGGVACFLNPEPLAPFIDCFILGEAEDVLAPFFERFDPAAQRAPLLAQLAREVPGVYVPAFYKDHYHADGTLKSFEPQADVPGLVQRVIASDLSRFHTQSVVLTPRTTFEDAFLIEVSRGCPHGCRFCSAGFIYRPPRRRSLPQLSEALESAAVCSPKVGLVGTAVSDLPELKELCRLGHDLDLQLGFSSLRADALDEELVAALKTGRLKTATIAPETGSERMRRVINKGMDEAAILTAAERIVAGGIPNLKLYFMVGLPTETDEDVDQIITLVKKIKHCFLSASRSKGHMGEITVSLNCFVPKPFTPFQWTAMDEVPVLKDKIRKVKKNLDRIANVRTHADVPRWAHLQGLLSRGDRRVADLLEGAHANQGNWPRTFKESIVNPSFYVHRERRFEERLPWDFIDQGVSRQFLWTEYQRALAGKTTKPCPMQPDQCRACGVCGHETSP